MVPAHFEQDNVARVMQRRFVSRTCLPAAIAVLMTAHTARAADDDPWFGRDKALHFAASATIAGAAYGIAATQFDARWPRLLVGGATAVAVGAGKEGADALGLGDPSWRDFTWDVIGAVVGLAIAWGIDVAVRGVGSSHPAFGAPATR